MTDRIAMESDELFVELLPTLGAAVTAFELKNGPDRLPVFRRWSGADDRRSVSSSPLVPWFNRISGGGFTFGAFYPIAPNDPIEPVPIHGDGWYSPWVVAERSLTRVVMTLRSRAIPPFDYEATRTMTLDGPRLTMELAVRHCGTTPIPYGLGEHPWFDRTPGVTIHAPATGAWLVQPPDFPTSPTPDTLPDKWDFNAPRPLPDDFIDNGFAGWNGKARIEWADRGLALDVEADPSTPYYHVYSPDKDSPVFCFEPVTHPFNAYAMPGKPEDNGLRVLAPGEETSLRVHWTAGLR